jgi:signal transduction histidine kinase
LVSELFHSLSQPLTALQCALELSVLQDQTSQEFRATVESALENTQRIRQCLLLARELEDADDPGNSSGMIRLDRMLEQLVEELIPLSESVGRKLELMCDPVTVCGCREKLSRAFFYLLTHLLSLDAPGQPVAISVQKKQLRIRIRISGCPSVDTVAGRDKVQEIHSTPQVEIARRIFRAAGGALLWQEPHQLSEGVWTVELSTARGHAGV